MNEIISYEEFERYIDSIQMVFNVENSLMAISSDVRAKSKNEFTLYFPSLITEVIELLGKAVDDKDDWISYFIFELDFGKQNDILQVKDSDGNIIPLRTTKDLWNIIKTTQEGCEAVGSKRTSTGTRRKKS